MTELRPAPRPRETCGQCGFDSDLYDRADTVSSQRIVPAVLAAAVEGLDEQALLRRPDEATWSIAEYIDHVREVAFGNRFAIEATLAEPGTDLGDPPAGGLRGPARQIDVDAALAGVTDEYEAMTTLLDGLAEDRWATAVKLGGELLTVGWFARHVIHDGLHHLADIGRIRAGFGLGARAVTGRITALHVSDGGVPKRPVQSLSVEPSGAVGDRQADRRHHGRPVQAVCLWSAGVIADLQAEGHPIFPGAAGENITVDVDSWSDLRPGAQLDVGPVRLLVTAHAIPCAKNARWFGDRDVSRILHQAHPGASRLYALPLSTGSIVVGDRVRVEPGPDAPPPGAAGGRGQVVPDSGDDR